MPLPAEPALRIFQRMRGVDFMDFVTGTDLG